MAMTDDSIHDYYRQARERFKERALLMRKRQAMPFIDGCGCEGCECALPEVSGGSVPAPLVEVAGVRFRDTSRTFYVDPAGHALEAGQWVFVETERGLELGQVVIAPQQLVAASLEGDLRPIERVASDDDLERAESWRAREGEAVQVFARKVRDHGLQMKPLAAEYGPDGTRLTLFFAANGRIDFRALVRDLAGHFRCRIELRQVGARDEARLIGGLGKCGRPLCCTTWLANYVDVTMTMARNQDLPKNPDKLSGACGKLLCCLAYEDQFYREARTRLPRLGQAVQTAQGPGYVAALNILRETVSVRLESGVQVELAPAEVEPQGGAGEPSRRRVRRDTVN
jgi:cell fate regulator YaaT (PSP1 superfamily)